MTWRVPVSVFLLSLVLDSALAQSTQPSETTAEDRAKEALRRINEISSRLGPRWVPSVIRLDGSLKISADSKRKPERIGKGIFRLWVRWDFYEPKISASTKYDAMLEHVEVDCQAGKTRALKISYYDGQDHVQSFDTPKSEWESVTPETTAEMLLNDLCETTIPMILSWDKP